MIADYIAGILSGFISALGLGGGGILIIYLTLIRGLPQTQAQGMNLIFFIPISLSALIMHTKNRLIDWNLAIKFILFGLIGLIIGSKFINLIDEAILSKIFSVILISIGIKELFLKKEK